MIQDGYNNLMTVDQKGGYTTSGVEATQSGNYNEMTLTQDGENNMAKLTQEGSGNAMTAHQFGNNQLTWAQIGNGLPNLIITQPAGTALLVTQTH